MTQSIALLDWIIIAFYCFGLLFMAWWLSRKQDSREDYYIGGRSMGTWPVGISIMATQCSTNSIPGAPAFVAFTLVMSFIVGDIAPTVLEAINQIGSLANGPILAVFALGFLTSRVRGLHAIAGLLGGLAVNAGAGSPCQDSHGSGGMLSVS